MKELIKDAIRTTPKSVVMKHLLSILFITLLFGSKLVQFKIDASPLASQ